MILVTSVSYTPKSENSSLTFYTLTEVTKYVIVPSTWRNKSEIRSTKFETNRAKINADPENPKREIQIGFVWNIALFLVI
jgi:hypothetical protein